MDKLRTVLPNQACQSGQTLIETLVAAFILVMGITAAVGLAVFAYSSSTNISKQIVATGLAREGLEAIKYMRDTNWLRATIDRDCYNFSSTPVGSTTPAAQVCPGGPTGGSCCYKSWLNPSGGFNYNLNPPSDEKSYILSFDPAAALYWDLRIENSRYGLNMNSLTDPSTFKGYYTPEPSLTYGNSDFYRKVTLSTKGSNSASPFDTNIGPKLRVISQVWWTDKKCPRHSDWQNDGKCSIQLETQLTNWKNY